MPKKCSPNSHPWQSSHDISDTLTGATFIYPRNTLVAMPLDHLKERDEPPLAGYRQMRRDTLHQNGTERAVYTSMASNI